MFDVKHNENYWLYILFVSAKKEQNKKMQQAEKHITMDQMESNSIPLWMKVAAGESAMNINDSDSSMDEEDDEDTNNDSVKSLPTVDYEKNRNISNTLNNNKELQMQRNQKNKENTKARTRKITPSHAPSMPPLKQLASMKKAGAQFEITEEEEEEDE